jgi:hypothetical protein
MLSLETSLELLVALLVIAFLSLIWHTLETL